MTRPNPWRRTTAAQRREQRAAFKRLKAECAAEPSAEMLREREKSRVKDHRIYASRKVKRALTGSAIDPFSMLQAAKIRPEEHDRLRAEVSRRLAQLTAKERAAVNRNQHLILVTLSIDMLRTVAAGLR